MADLRNVNLNRLAVFAAVVEAGSLTGAAERLGLAKTMVSTHMQRLEAEVGTSLLVRTTRRLSLTDAGQAFFEASRTFLHAAEDALAAIHEDVGSLRGSLRVGAPIDYGTLVVTPALVKMRQQHPELKIELICNDQNADLIAERIDVAIRLGRLKDSSYRMVRLGDYEQWLVASPDFLARHGVPATPEALATLPYISFSIYAHPYTVQLQSNKGEKRRIRCDDVFFANAATACRAATLAGGGFGLLTEFSVTEDVAAGRLVRLLPDWTAEPGGIHAVFPSASHTPAKVRALIAVLKAQLDP
ncbi:MAG: LysR family transcriptional regulator [Burkholderiales bacterium]|nr:LysR family transcriptional regulator [Burkholderiales bacterium]